VSPGWRPLDPDAVPLALATLIAERAGRVRVAVDGAWAADPHPLAESLVAPLRALGRPVEHMRAETFWRDAALRLEYGRTDVHAFRHDWLDTDALPREVLAPLGPGGSGEFLTSLRDPRTNRATRSGRVTAAADQIVLVSGELLLGRDLPFEVAVHLHLSPPALARRTPEDRSWTLPAFDGYSPSADAVIKVDDPRHPALRLD
jgi:hypothetical protein